jgi:hypothetical protein
MSRKMEADRLRHHLRFTSVIKKASAVKKSSKLKTGSRKTEDDEAGVKVECS